jgi:hypothetical protein
MADTAPGLPKALPARLTPVVRATRPYRCDLLEGQVSLVHVFLLRSGAFHNRANARATVT